MPKKKPETHFKTDELTFVGLDGSSLDDVIAQLTKLREQYGKEHTNLRLETTSWDSLYLCGDRPETDAERTQRETEENRRKAAIEAGERAAEEAFREELMLSVPLKTNPRTGLPVRYGPGPRISRRYRLRAAAGAYTKTGWQRYIAEWWSLWDE